MRFSVIIPVYNAEKYIERTLCELLKQDCTLFEIVLVDDGSQDKSGEICDRYADDHPDQIKVIHQQNQGQLAARCQGILHSTGDYCAFLDADDLLMPDVFSDVEQRTEQYDCPKVIMFPFYYDKSGRMEKSKLLNEQEHFYTEDDMRVIYESFFSTTLLNSMWTKIVRRDIAAASTKGYESYTNLRCAEDRYQSMMILRYADNLLYIPTPYYRYRLVEGSVSRQYSPETIKRFNTAKLYEPELESLRMWGIDSLDCIKRFQASWLSYALYVLDLFYYKVPRKERQLVLSYPWEQFLPDVFSVETLLNDSVFSDQQKKMWQYIIDRNYRDLKWHFLKKGVYTKLKKWKRSVFDRKRDRTV